MSEHLLEEKRLLRKAKRHEKKRDEIVAAAREVLARKGPQNFSMAKVAQEADVTKAALYYYFDSQDELIGAVVSELFEREIATITEKTQNIQSGIESLCAFVQEMVALHRDNLRMFRVQYVWSQIANLTGTGYLEKIYAQVDTLNASLERKLKIEQATGELGAEVKPRVLANLAWMTAAGILMAVSGMESAGGSLKATVDQLVANACLQIRANKKAAQAHQWRVS